MEGARRHHFMKVMVGEFTRRLEIPHDFLVHIPEVATNTSDTSLPSSAKGTLQNFEGKTWPVELEKLDGRVYLTTGWTKFVEDNFLRKFEFLLFRYDENMHFMVLPFSLNACEKVIRSSGSPEGKLPYDIFCSNERVQNGRLTEAVNSLTPSHSQIVTLQRSAQGHEHISAQSCPDQHETCLLKNGLDEHLSLKGYMEDDKANAIAEVMRTLDVDKVTVELFCAMLGFYKWNVDAVAEVFDICKGKPHIQNQFLKHKLLFQFDTVKRKLRNFFLPDDYYSSPIPKSRKSGLEDPKLSNQSLQRDLTAVSCRLVDECESRNFSQKKRRINKLQRGSCRRPETPRRSPRLACQNNARASAKSTLKERSEDRELSAASTIDHTKDGAEQACLYPDKADNGSFQDSEQVKTAHDEVDLEPRNSQGENEGNLDKVNNKEIGEEQTEINAVETFESLMRSIESSPTNCEVSAYSRLNGLCLTWKPTEHVDPLEKVLLDIQRDNFVKTISHVQGIMRNHPSDLLTADVITTVVQKEILKWDHCLEDRDAQRIVNALLEHAKKIKEMHNFNLELRKEEFSAKLQVQLKWQLKEVETAYTSLELDYKKATSDDNAAFSSLHEQKKKLHNLQNEITGLQQSLEMKKDEMQKLSHQIAEHESVFQKSLMERIRIKEVMKSYEQTLAEVKVRLTSTEVGSIDVEALVKVEMDNMTKEIELSKESLLNITFK